MWGVSEELLAQLIEEVSVLASDRRREEPLTIPRPGSAGKATEAATSAPATGLTGSKESGFQARGLEGFLQMTEVMGGAQRNE